MELLLVYLWLKLDTILGVFGPVIGVGVVLTAGVWFWIYAAEDGPFQADEENIKRSKERSKWFRRWLHSLLAISITFVTFMPDSKQLAVLVGTHYALQLVKSPEGEKINKLIRAQANHLLDEQLKALEEKK